MRLSITTQRLTYLDTSVRARIDIDSKALVQIDHVRIDIDM